MGSTPAPKQGELDGWIGSRIRDRRRMLGLAQHELAEALGISHQQLQKYEAGKNRISASRLWWCADALDMPMDYFFFERPVRQAADRSTTRNEVRPKVPYAVFTPPELKESGPPRPPRQRWLKPAMMLSFRGLTVNGKLCASEAKRVY
jgi:transcriptional regulator with XRE-family HTH domain